MRANPSQPIGEVHIDLPPRHDPNPAPPPPPTSSGDRPEKTIFLGECNKETFIFVAVCASIIGVIIYWDSIEYFPRFQLDHVSVSVKNDTAVWDIGYSMDFPAGHLDLWARFMSRDFKVESPGNAAGNWTMSVSTLLPRGAGTSFPGGLKLEQVVFKCNNYEYIFHRYVVEAVCKDVTVEILSNETTGQWATMKGGPRRCPVVYHDRIDFGGF